MYQHNTSNTQLRVHLDKFHRVKYLELAAQRGWTIQLASQKEVRRIAISNTVESARTPFSADAVIDQIVKFIVANDQVRVK